MDQFADDGSQDGSQGGSDGDRLLRRSPSDDENFIDAATWETRVVERIQKVMHDAIAPLKLDINDMKEAFSRDIAGIRDVLGNFCPDSVGGRHPGPHGKSRVGKLDASARDADVGKALSGWVQEEYGNMAARAYYRACLNC